MEHKHKRLKKWILDNCFTKDGNRINSRFISKNNSPELAEILKATEQISDGSVSFRLYKFLSDDIAYNKCIECGNDISPNKNSQLHCCRKCSCGEKRTKKIKKTKKERYGDENYRNDSKIKETCAIRYGGDSPFHSAKIQNKVRDTVYKRYGVDNISKAREIKNKKMKSLDDSLSPEWVAFKNNKEYAKYMWGSHTPVELSELFGIDLSSIYKYASIHNLGIKYKHKSTSSYETLLINEIRKFYNGNIIQSDRTVIYPLELDIYIPEKKIAIEICGLYWHSEIYKDREYHKNKMVMCYKKGVFLITLFEDEMINSLDIIINKLKYILTGPSSVVYARNTNIKMIDTNIRNEFLNRYHIQGTANGKTIGLYYNDTIVALGVFRKRTNTEYELSRFCTSCSVIGGFSKIMHYFKKEYENISSVISFADLRIVNKYNNVYISNGWELDNVLKPDYYFIKKQKRFHKFRLRKLDNKDKEYLNHGYLKIYDCGKLKYKLSWGAN